MGVLDRLLGAALDFQRRLANNQILLSVVTGTFNYFGNGLVYVCIYFGAPSGLSGADLAAFVAKVSMITINFIMGLTMIMSVIQIFAKLCGYSTRIRELIEAASEYHEIGGATEDPNQVAIRDATVIGPTHGGCWCSTLRFGLLRRNRCSLVALPAAGNHPSSGFFGISGRSPMGLSCIPLSRQRQCSF
jgi:hypothetical protein